MRNVSSRIVRILFCTAAGLFVYASAAAANSGAFNGSGGSVVPVDEDRVRMVSEDVTFEFTTLEPSPHRELDGWRVSVRHVFRNTADERVELTLGFPELECGGDHACSDGDFAIDELKTRVRGEEVDERIEQVDGEETEKEWAEGLGRVHLYDVTFEPNERVVVEHEYTHPKSGSIDAELQLTYVTRTGGLWKGSIESATFTVRMPLRFYYLYFPKEYSLVSREHSPGIDGDRKLVFEAEDWDPSSNFSLLIPSHRSTRPANCPGFWHVDDVCSDEKHERPKDLRKRLFRAFVKDYEPDDEDVSWEEGMSARMRTCRNLPYAVHGYTFESEDLREFFYRYPEPEVVTGHPPLAALTGDKSNHKIVGVRPNSEYDQSLFSSAQWNYVKASEYVAEHAEDLLHDYGNAWVKKSEKKDEKSDEEKEVEAYEAICGEE